MINLPSVKIKLGDVFLVIILLFISGFLMFFLFHSDGKQALISWNGGSAVYPLDEDIEFNLSSSGYNLCISISKGRIGVISSDCPDKVCVHSGTIKRGSIICVPAGVIIQIQDEGTDNADFIIS